MYQNKTVSIIVLNYNKWEILFECLDSILILNNPSKINLIIVDNASENDSVKKVLEYYGEHYKEQDFVYNNVIVCQFSFVDKKIFNEIILLQPKENRGYAFGNNIGLYYSVNYINTDYYWLLSNDTKVYSNSLDELLIEAENNKLIGLLGSTLIEYKDSNCVQAIAGKYNKIIGQSSLLFPGINISMLNTLPSIYFNISFPIGAALFLKKEFLSTVGYMSEIYYLYFEELDWTIRGRKNGWIVAVSTKSKIVHKGGATISQKSKITDYISIRSRIIFTMLYYPYLTPIIYMSTSMYVFNRLLRKQYDRIFPVLRILLNPYISIKKCLQWANN